MVIHLFRALQDPFVWERHVYLLSDSNIDWRWFGYSITKQLIKKP